MNKKLVLSVLSTAVVASMASAAMAKPQPGFYVGGDVDKYYSIDAFLGDHFDDALDNIISELGDTVFVDKDANAAPFVEALDANTAEELAAIMKPATVATFNGNVYTNVEDPTADPYNPANDPDLKPGVPVEWKIDSVSAIETTYVEVTFPALAEALEGVTVEVKDSKNNVVEVQPTNIAKGATFAQFDFVKPITVDDQKGVWTVAGVEYSFVAKEQLEKIVTTAGATNDVAFRAALDAAGITNINNAYLSDYKAVIVAVATAPKSLADVQKIVDDVNAKKANNDVVVKPVLDAKNQIDLLAALEANFARVNRDWIESYITADGAAAPGIEIKVAPAANTVHPTAGPGVTATAEAIQEAIDAVNLIEIEAADDAVTGTNLKASEQAKVTALIQKYQKDDEGTSKVKAEAVKASQVKEAVLRAKEAKTQNSVYTALVNLSNVDSDNLKASELNINLASYYFAEQQKAATQTALEAKTTASVKTNVVEAADKAALDEAVDAVNTTAGAYDAADAKTKTAFQNALQKLADVTSHKTNDLKFDASKVNAELLEKYADAIDSLSTAAATAKDVQDAIKGVNDAAGTDSSVEAINKATTASQVKAALDKLAISVYVNVPSADKLYIAEKVLEARDEETGKEFADKDAVETALGTKDTTGILKDYADLVAKFNFAALTDTETTIAALSELGYAAFDNLSAGEQADVAEKFVANYPVDKNDDPVDYKTLAAVKAGVDAAIAAK